MPSCLEVGFSKITGKIKDKSTSFHQIPNLTQEKTPKKNRLICARRLNNMGNTKSIILFPLRIEFCVVIISTSVVLK